MYVHLCAHVHILNKSWDCKRQCQHRHVGSILWSRMLTGRLIKSSSCSKAMLLPSWSFSIQDRLKSGCMTSTLATNKDIFGWQLLVTSKKDLAPGLFSLRYKMWPDAELTGRCWNKERRRDPAQVKRYGVRCCLLIRYNTNARSFEVTLDVPEVRFLLCGNFSSPGDWNMMRSAETLKSPLPL